VTIVAKPLTPEEFAPYGDVQTSPPDFGRIYYDHGLATLRPTARPSLTVRD
jgi:ureidoglycolate hydrolase